MTPTEKLDAVLNFFSTQTPLYKPYFISPILTSLTNSHPELNEQNDFASELKSILQKLYKDDYLNIKDNTSAHRDSSGNPQKEYSITFEGMYFIKHQDGYQGLDHRRKALAQAEADKERRVSEVEASQLAQTVKMAQLTRWAAILSACLILWELLKYFVFEHHWYFHSF